MTDKHTFRLYNTLTRQVEPLAPAVPGLLAMYACGPTVYSFAHIGNFRTFLTSDLIIRTARAIGWNTRYVTNVTDVGHLTEDDFADASGEDKMARALRSKEGQHFANVWDLARYYTNVLLDEWNALNLLEPDVRPRATEHITPQIDAVERLMASGHAYETEQGVYFHVPSFPGYGKLSGNQDADLLGQGVRDVIQDTEKRDPRDFALWKKDPHHLMQWYSPFGKGFPGWHLECSVMSMTYLGDTIDVHAGGEDLIFPHHECEIAQAESLTGRPFVRHWVHTRFLMSEGEKMSKSRGNYYTIRDLIAPESEGGRGVDPLALRYALISGKYRERFNFTLRHLRDSARIVQRYTEVARGIREAVEHDLPGPDHAGPRLDAVYEETLQALLDDLNTPVALASSLKGIKLIQGMQPLNGASARSAGRWLEKTNGLLGFIAAEEPRKKDMHADDGLAEPVDQLIAERNEARKAKDYALADRLREQIEALGVEIMDTPDGTRWRKRVDVPL